MKNMYWFAHTRMNAQALFFVARQTCKDVYPSTWVTGDRKKVASLPFPLSPDPHHVILSPSNQTSIFRIDTQLGAATFRHFVMPPP